MRKRYLLLFLLIVTSLQQAAAGQEKNFRLIHAQTTPKVLNFIKDNYIDQGRINPHEMLKGALNQLQKSAAEILVTFDSQNRFTITIDKAVKKFNPKPLNKLEELWGVLRDVYTFIEVHYHGSIEPHDLEYLMIDGMLSVLDPHSNILTPKIFNEFKIGTKGKFGGIGIVIGSRDGNLTVISPIEDTPAWRAGIKAGDKITQIGEESTVNMSLTEAVELLRGDVGTNVTITVEREGRPAPFNVTLKRAIIKIDSVQSASIPAGGRSIGYIKIKNFQEDTDKEFARQLSLLKEEPNFSGLILDLRNDPGGLLNQAVAITDRFIDEGVIVSTIGAGNKFLEQETARPHGTEPLYPMIVLVNEGSASASEIVAGTLQNYKRAVVMGSQTFGKGSVQTIFDLRDGSALKLTIAEYLTAGRNSIQSVGVVPDIKLVPVKIDKDKMDLIEDEHETEKNLEAHLSQYADSIIKKESPYKLVYLQPVEKEDEDEASRREYSNKLDFSKDTAVQFAGRILVNAPADSREALLESAVSTIKDIEKGEREKITASLQKLGIDWSECRAYGRPLLQVSFSLQKNDKPIKEAAAGEEVDMVLTAKNVGTGPFCQLIGVTESKDPVLKNKEFVFGKMEPAAVKKWTVPFKVPKNIVNQNMPFTVRFHEENSNQPAAFKAGLPVTGLPAPRFAFNFRLGQPLNVKVATTPMPAGKTIPMIVDVKNIGEGAAQNAVAIIKNDIETKGIFIDTGRIKIGRLEPGRTKRLTFKFHIEPSFARTAFDLELTIADQDLFTALTKKIEFNASNGVSNPKAGQWYHGPMISFGTASFPIVTTSSKYRIEADITDDKEVKDYLVFVGEEKAAYSSNPDQTNKYRLSVDLPLKEGNNFISIIARDNLDMMTKRSFIIERK